MPPVSPIHFALSKVKDAICLIYKDGSISQSNTAFESLIALRSQIQDCFFIDVHGKGLNWDVFFEKVRNAIQVTQRLGIWKNGTLRFFHTESYYYQNEEDECICLLIKPHTPDEYSDEVDEEHLTRIMNTFPVILCGWDHLGNFRFWNTECERVLGYTKADMLANPDGMSYLYPEPEVRKKIMDLWLNCLQQQTRIRNWELDVTCKDGNIRTISWTIQYENDPFMGLSTWGIGIDITEKINARKALEISEKRFMTISKATNDAVWDWNLITDELVWNDGITNLFGHPDDQIEKNIQWWQKNIHPDDHDRVINRIYEFVRRGEEFWWDEYRFCRLDGSYAFVYDKGHIIRDDTGKSIRMIGGILDITDRKIYEQSLEVKNYQLAEYVFHNSHKVRAPLARLLGLAYLLNEQHPDSSESREMIERIKTAADEIDLLTRHVSNVML